MSYIGCNPYLLMGCVVMIFYIVYRYMTETYSQLQKLGIKGPKPVWIFGNVLEFKNKDVLSVFKKWKEIYGKVYGFYEGFRAGIVVNDPDFAKEILSTNFDQFYVRTSYRPFTYYPDDLQLINLNDGQHWKNQRSVLNKTLNFAGTMNMLIDKVQNTSVKFLKTFEESRLQSPSGFDISELIERQTSENVMRLVLDMNDEDIEEYGEMIYEYQKASNFSASAENEVGGLARLFPSLTPILKRADKKHKDLHEKLIAFLRTHIQKVVLERNGNDLKDSDHMSILSHLLSSKVLAKDIDGSTIRRDLINDEIIAHIVALIGESYQTTMAAIKYTLYELACNQDCQEQLYDEICRTCGQSDKMTLSQLQDMTYFDMVFYEAYRLHPVAPGLSRTCTADCTIRGLKLKKGMVVRIMTSALYTDEKYFSEPAKFIPERFSEEKREDMHQYLFLPYGQGPRMCPGYKIAMLQIKTVIINILKHYRLDTCKTTQIPLHNALRPSLCPAGEVNICFTNRSGTSNIQTSSTSSTSSTP